ncbi:hypothetical protein Ancab_027452 [Ancistrocladus abbreviatus]
MNLKFALWNICFPLLVIMLKADFPGNKQDDQAKDMNKAHHPHMDPSVLVFFTLDDLKVGKRISLYFPVRRYPHLLPKQDAESIPFTLAELPSLLDSFSFPHDSPQAKAMEETLRQCGLEPIEGEIKFCATSLESMLDFVRSVLGTETKFQALATTMPHLGNLASSVPQYYTILDVPEEILAPKMVACHTMPYPYAVFYCHYQVTESRVFKVLLGGEKGDRVNAVAVCHMDTSQWSHNHVSFLVLGIKAGSSPVCHFFPADNLVWSPIREFSATM